jgi:transposase-like protein
MTPEKKDEIVAFYKENDWSYQLVAERFGVSRNQVAGLIFRSKHGNRKLPKSIGHHGPGDRPKFTARTHEGRAVVST